MHPGRRSLRSLCPGLGDGGGWRLETEKPTDSEGILPDVSDGTGKKRNTREDQEVTSPTAFGSAPDVSDALASDLAKNQSTRSGSERPLQAGAEAHRKLLPRANRRRRRAASDRGLPGDAELMKLVHAYLETQHRLWPNLLKAGLLPDLTDGTVRAMVEDFKHRHRTAQVEPVETAKLLKYCESIGGNYDRFSSDNSEPKSNIDQMVESLTKAREENCFIPWQYVFCDYSISGLDASRQGYSSYKKILQEKPKDAKRKDPTVHPIRTTYIADFSRASRDELEWWQLASLSRRLGKGLVGAEDNFRLDDPDWDMKLTMYGLLSRLFIKQLRQKVGRGMRSAGQAGDCLRRPSLGFTRRPRVDEHGRVIVKSNGKPKTEECPDPQTVPHRLEMYERFVNEGWSGYKIAKDFNQRKVDDWNGWEPGGILKLLWNPDAIGVLIFNRYRREWDEEKWVKVENPRSEWIIQYRPEHAIVPIPLWKAARRKIYASRRTNPRTGKPQQRRHTPSTLFDGVLLCADCTRRREEPQELRLYRSTEKYKDLCCPNGRRGAHGCGLSTSKAVRIIEEALLGHIREYVFTEQAVRALFEKANAYLAEEAARPREDVEPLKVDIRRREASIKRLVRLTEAGAGEDEADEEDDLLQDYITRVKQLRQEVIDLRRQLRDKEARNADPPASLSMERVQQYVADLRAILNQDVPASAEALRALTGPIHIHQEKIPAQKRGATWIATFSPSLLNLLARIAKEKDYPESITLEHLKQRIWIKEEPVHVTVQRINVTEQIADAVVAALNAGTPREQVAEDHNVDPTTVDRAWWLRVHGIDRSDYDPSLRAFGPPRQRATRPEEVMDQVAALRHEEGLDLKQIAQRLDLPVRVVGEAHRLWHEQHPDGPGDIPWVVLCGKAGKLTPAQRRQVCELALAGWREHQIVEKLPFEKGHVHRVLTALRREQERRGQGSS